MEEIRYKTFKGERALFGEKGLKIVDCVFEDGESPLKECFGIELYGSAFRWKYPLWYCNNILARDCAWFENARAGVWYSDNVSIENAVIQAPKNFRRCRNLSISDTVLTNAKETLWSCSGVKLKNVTAAGDYFAMNCEDARVDGLILDGNYSFDGAKNVTIRNSRLLTKDAFWNSENITVYDSYIYGEYLGWNSKKLTLIHCTVESLQGMCYIDSLVMKNCRLLNTTLAFEYSSVDAEIASPIDSVFNPKSGIIAAPEIGDLIIEKDRTDPGRVKIICEDVKKRSEYPDWTKV